jgi:hypothetical protein
MRRLGILSPALTPLREATPDAFAAAVGSLASHPRPSIGVRTLATLTRHGLPPDDGRRVADAAIALGQAGTGSFGTGRSLPRHLRLPLWGLAGILATDIP